MSVAQVVIKTIDLSTRVPGFRGVYGAIALPGAKCGPLDATLCTSETQFLTRYTPRGKLEVGYDVSYYSALAYLNKSDKLWVRRVVNNAAYSGVVIKAAGSTSNTKALAAELVNPETYVFEADDSFLITSADPGKWGDGLSVSISDYSAKEPGAFAITIYQDGIQATKPLIASIVEGSKDGFGRSLYVEEVSKTSDYIRIIDNPLNESAPALFDTPVPLTLGDDGDPVTTGQVMLAMDRFANKDDLPVTIMMDGGYTVASYQRALTNHCENRKDCVAILGVPYEVEADADYLNAIVTYRRDTLNMNTSYAALYSPHVRIYSKYIDRDVYVSPTGFVGGAISETATNQEIWYPVAGFRRGMLNVDDTLRRFTQGEMSYLQDNGINPIRFAPGRGILIWGHKTMLARPSALDRLNVQLLLIYMQPAIAYALEDFIFEINDEQTRAVVRAMIDNYMANIKGRRGVYNYSIVCDETNNTPYDIDNYQMNVWVYIEPTKGAEIIEFSTIITPTGAITKLKGA